MQVIKSWILCVVPLQCKKQPHHILAGASKSLLSTFFTEEVQAFGITGDGISQVTWYPENKFGFFRRHHLIHISWNIIEPKKKLYQNQQVVWCALHSSFLSILSFMTFQIHIVHSSKFVDPSTPDLRPGSTAPRRGHPRLRSHDVHRRDVDKSPGNLINRRSFRTSTTKHFMEVVKRARPAEAYRNLLVLRSPNKILEKDET